MDGLTPAIVRAARSEAVIEAALAYAELRISVMPCKGKLAATDWKPRQEKRASRTLIQTWDLIGALQNVGIVCGSVSENLVVMDLDGAKACEAFALTFPELTLTYTVASGSGNGAHLYFYVDALPPTTRVTSTGYGNIELRANGCYVIAPPSIHPSGKPYSISRPIPILNIPNMQDVVAWIKRLMVEKHGGQMPAAAGKYQRPVRNGDYWAVVALQRESDAVRTASFGERNNTLNRAAFKLGQLVKEGRLSRTDVEQALMSAAAGLAADDGEQAVIRTINSGLNAGMSKPVWRKQS